MLSQNIEELLVQMLIRHSQRWTPMIQRQLVECIPLMLHNMTAEQCNTLKIDNVEKYKPSPSYLTAFRRLHCGVIKFARPFLQEGKRFRANNGKVVANHFATLEKLLKENSLGHEHLFNFDECGITPDKNCTGRLVERRFLSKRTWK